MSNLFDFDRISKTEYNLQHFTRKCRIKNFDDFERDEADVCLWRAGLLNVKEKGMTIRYIMNWCLVMFFERRETKCCAVLMKYRQKVKGKQLIIFDEQVITLQMTQELKTKNINIVPGQLSCIQCKAKFLLETDSLYW